MNRGQEGKTLRN